MPYFSVIIPLYNKENQIEKCLNSILNQSFTNFEIIIINDGSTDKGLEKVKSIKDKRIQVFSQKNKGVSYTRNLGVKKAKSNYIALIDADDFWEKNHLQAFYDAIQKFPEADLFCNAYHIILSDKFSHKATYHLKDPTKIQQIEDYFLASKIHAIAFTSAVCFSKKSFEDLGGFNVDSSSREDMELWVKFALQKQIIFNPAYTAYYDKTVEESLSKKNYGKAELDFFESFKKEEQKNLSLKKYMDLNRYSVAIQAKINGNKEVYSYFKNELDMNSLNTKQIALLKSPIFMIRRFKKIQNYMRDKNLYISAFK